MRPGRDWEFEISGFEKGGRREIMKGREKSSATPAGVDDVDGAFRGCRGARPPATGWDASGVGKLADRTADQSGNGRRGGALEI